MHACCAALPLTAVCMIGAIYAHACRGRTFTRQEEPLSLYVPLVYDILEDSYPVYSAVEFQASTITWVPQDSSMMRAYALR